MVDTDATRVTCDPDPANSTNPSRHFCRTDDDANNAEGISARGSR